MSSYLPAERNVAFTLPRQMSPTLTEMRELAGPRTRSAQVWVNKDV